MIYGLTQMMPVCNIISTEPDWVLLADWLKLIGTKQISSTSQAHVPEQTIQNAGSTKQLNYIWSEVFIFLYVFVKPLFPFKVKELQLQRDL